MSNVFVCSKRSLPPSSCSVFLCIVLFSVFVFKLLGILRFSSSRHVPIKARNPMVLPRPAFDVSLRQTLLGPRSPLNAKKIGACFVYPPWGVLVGYISGTSGSARDIRWNRPGVMPGTRYVPGWPNTRERYLGKFCKSGAPPWSHAVVLPRDLPVLRWRTRPLAEHPTAAVAARPKF